MLIYSEKATKFCEISTLDLSYIVSVKYMVEILQNFVALSEYMNFKKKGGEHFLIQFFLIASIETLLQPWL